MEKGVLNEEREKIRELHQRQQDSLKSLQALENRFCHIAINDEETLRGSSAAFRVPTLELMANAQVVKLPPLEKVPKPQPNAITIELSTPNDSDTSDSDATMSGDDNEEQISTEELAKAADHVKKLLKRITMLQKNFDVDKKKHRKRHVHKMYQRFCRKFESGIKLPSAADFGKVAPFIDFDMNDNSGSLENFDFDSFLHVPGESTRFPLDDFYFSQGQRAVPQQTPNLDAISSTQSSQYPPLVSYESVEPIPFSTAYTIDYPPMPAADAAPGTPSDPSAQRPERSLNQEQSALPQPSPESLAQIWARRQRQAQTTAQQQAQAQSQAAMQRMTGMAHSLPSPAMPMLTRPMLPPTSTSGLTPPSYMKIVMPETSQSSQSGVGSSLHTQSPMLTADSTLLPQPPSPNTALRDYQYQLMFLDCRKRRSNPPHEQEQDGDSQLTTNRRQLGTSLSQSRKKARSDPDASPFTHGQPNTLNAGKTEAGNGKPLRGRKKALTAEQRRNAAAMRLIGACQNCQSLNLKVPYVQLIFPLFTNQLQCNASYPCGSCIKRNAEQEELPSEACRRLKIADHTEGFLVTSENPRPPSGVPVPSIPSSGYEEPDADDSHGKESLQINIEKRVGSKRPRSRSPESRSKLFWSPLASQQPSPDHGMEHAIQFDSKRRLRVRKDRVDHGSESTANISFPLVKNEETTATETASTSVDRDIVDVLLEEWTVPVY